MSDEEIVTYSKDQREPREGEPSCVVIHELLLKNPRFVANMESMYVTKRMKMFAASNARMRPFEDTERRRMQLSHHRVMVELNFPLNIDASFYNWRVGAYYKYVTWSGLYTNKDVSILCTYDSDCGNPSRTQHRCHRRVLPFPYPFPSSSIQVISFNDIALPETLRRNLLSMGVSSPTPIQMESVTPFL